MEAFSSLEPPSTFSDVRMIVGMLVFYSPWISMYELRILPLRELIKQTPLIGEGNRKTNNAASIRGIWESYHM
jgi:hypothetical protein